MSIFGTVAIIVMSASLYLQIVKWKDNDDIFLKMIARIVRQLLERAHSLYVFFHSHSTHIVSVETALYPVPLQLGTQRSAAVASLHHSGYQTPVRQ